MEISYSLNELLLQCNTQHVPVCYRDIGSEYVCTKYSWQWFAGAVQFAAVELQADYGKHEDRKKEQQADLQQRNHGLNYRLQDYLQTWKKGRQRPAEFK